ncbi:MAG: hypothetical protein HZB20_05565 [Chloroflexi bacterium]|nr:hypothetical protein [Chloroflexota bacterium]
MITYAQAMSAVRGVVCPRCLHAELSALFQLEDGSECVCAAHCEHCGQTFTIEFAKFETLEEVQRRIETHLAVAPCTICRQASYALSLRCDRPSQNCYFEARCRTCGVVYRAEARHSHVELARLTT